MFLKQVTTGDLVEVVDLTDVINPFSSTIRARVHTGEIIHRPEVFLKDELTFPSGASESPDPLKSGAMTRYPASTNVDIWLRQRWAESGKPCRRRTSGPSPWIITLSRMPFVSIICPLGFIALPSRVCSDHAL